jgi:hypothetical protein
MDRSPRSRVSLGAPRSRRCFLTNTRPGVNNSLTRSARSLVGKGNVIPMNRRFDPSTIGSWSEIPACRGSEVLFLLTEVDPISGKLSEQYPEAYPKEYRERVEKFSRNYIWRKITGDITIDFLEATSSSLKCFIADTTTSRYPHTALKSRSSCTNFF